MKRQLLFLIIFSFLFSVGRNAGAQCNLNAEFWFDPDTAFLNQDVYFYPVSDSNCTFTFQWFFDYGTPLNSSLRNPIAHWDTSGVFLITCILTNVSGSDTFSKYLPVRDSEEGGPSDCGSHGCLVPDACNQICNPAFTHNPNFSTFDDNSFVFDKSAFAEGDVNNWYRAWGTPDWALNGPPAQPDPGLASMWSQFGGDFVTGEGIYTCVTLQPYTNYILSYYRSKGNNLGTSTLDNVIVRVQDNFIPLTGVALPVFPSAPNSFVVSHEQNLNGTWGVWQQNIACFYTDNVTYNFLIMYPMQNQGSPQASVLFDKVELIEDEFTAGPDKTTCGGNITIGVSQCEVTNSVYTWYETSDLQNPIGTGQVISVSPNQTTSYTVIRTFYNPLIFPAVVADQACIKSDEVTVFVTNEGPGCCIDGFDETIGDIWIHPGWHSTMDLPAQYQTGFVGFTGYIYIEGTFFVDNDFAFTNCPNVYLAPGATIELEGFSVNDQATLRIQDSHLQGCDYLWNTIRADNDFESISVRCTSSGITIIEDAMTAITCLSQANFISSGTDFTHLVQFLDNRTHINLTGDPVQQAAPLITATKFSCGTLLPELGNPNPATKTVNAIRLSNMAGIIIGDPDGLDDISGTPDDIDLRNFILEFTDNGIWASNSSLEVRNTRFENTSNAATSTWGIKSEIGGLNPPNRFLRVIGNINDPLTTNEFIKLRTGILSTGTSVSTNMNVIITDGNIFSHPTTFGKYGIYVTKANKIQIFDNIFDYARFSNLGAAIETNTNDNVVELRILRNTITNNYQAVNSSPGDCWGIKHYQFNDLQIKVTIAENIISGGKFGIEVNGDDDVVIDQNTITLNRCWNTGNFGIRSLNADHTQITQNSVFKDYNGTCIQTNFKFTGIYCDASVDPNICENLLDGKIGNLMDAGIWLNSSAISTVNTKVLKNTFKYCNWAFVMSQGADMGWQPKTVNPATSENSWENCNDETYYALSIATNQSHESNFKYDPTCPGYALNCLPGPDNNNDLNVFPQIPFQITYSSDPDCGPWFDDGGGEGRMAAMIGEYNSMSNDETKWMKEQMLYQFAADSFSNSSSSVIQDFKETVEEKPVGDFKTIESLIISAYADTTLTTDTNAINLAISLNDAIVAENNFDLYRKQVNDVYLRTTAKGKEFANGDFQTLFAIASLCPYEGGTAVYQARVLIALVDTTSFDDNDCMIDAAYRTNPKDDKFADIGSTEDEQIEFYPNPAGNFLTIQFDSEIELPLQIDLFSNIGSLVKTDYCVFGKCEIDMSSIPNGVYFLRLNPSGENPIFEKLIIAK